VRPMLYLILVIALLEALMFLAARYASHLGAGFDETSRLRFRI
jgi:hypothetical protein